MIVTQDQMTVDRVTQELHWGVISEEDAVEELIEAGFAYRRAKSYVHEVVWPLPGSVGCVGSC